jgi:hypothetical protein
MIRAGPSETNPDTHVKSISFTNNITNQYDFHGETMEVTQYTRTRIFSGVLLLT